MKRIIGYLFNHDDTVSDRTEGSKQHTADLKTREHWKTHFNENFTNFGSMYRGTPPGGILYPMTMEDKHQICTNKTDITIDKVYLKFYPVTNLKPEKMKLRVLAAADAIPIQYFTKLKGYKTTEPLLWNEPQHFIFETAKANILRFLFQAKHGIFGATREIGSADIDIRLKTDLHVTPEAIGPGNIHETLQVGENQLEVIGHYPTPTPDKVLLFLDAGQYEDSLIPENSRALWGPVVLERLASGVQNKCQVATHRLAEQIPRFSIFKK